jgi:hypothetical protein
MAPESAQEPTGRPTDRPAADSQRRPNVEHADGVETVVYPERGRWVVEIVVMFKDGLVRHRIDTFPTKNRAELSADLIKRAAERDLRGPLNG